METKRIPIEATFDENLISPDDWGKSYVPKECRKKAKYYDNEGASTAIGNVEGFGWYVVIMMSGSGETVVWSEANGDRLK